MPKKGQSTLTARATQDHHKLTGEYQKKEERGAVGDREVKMKRRTEKNRTHLELQTTLKDFVYKKNNECWKTYHMPMLSWVTLGFGLEEMNDTAGHHCTVNLRSD